MKIMKGLMKSMAVFLAIYVFYCVYVYPMIPKDLPAHNAPISYSVDPELKVIADQLGMNTGNVTIKYSDTMAAPDARGEYENNTIRVKRGIENVPQTLAHEYLHHIYYSMDNTGEIDNAVNSLYKNDAPMHIRMQWYVDRDELNESEMFSVYCTESSDIHLTKEVIDLCNKYIKRSAITLVRQ